MGIRPAKTVRVAQGQVWTRVSRKTPRKSFVKGVPRSKIRQNNMGADKYYETQVDLAVEDDVQLRDNAFESARQAANKHLEKNLISNFFFGVLKYPHLAIREKGALGVAGADRISKGMKLAFGKPKGRMARVLKGEPIFRVRVFEKDVAVAKKALVRAKLKLSGRFAIIIKDIKNDVENLSKKDRAAVTFKKVEVPKVEAVAATADAAGAGAAAGAAGAKEAKGVEEGKAEGKKK